MCTYLWQHKFITLLFACAVAYFFLNPPGKFGYAQKNLVIFSRIPIAFFDLYIAPDGLRRLIENINSKETLNEFLPDLTQGPSNDKPLLIVGTGFEHNSFTLSDSISVLLEDKGIGLRQLPSGEAVKLYNSSKNEHKNVAILLCLKR
jgi:hypothetical protein